VRLSVGGLEACAHRHRHQGESPERVGKPAKITHLFVLSVARRSDEADQLFGLNRAPAASSNVASVAEVYSQCFQGFPVNFFRIRSSSVVTP
jgi:hypothetical protein